MFIMGLLSVMILQMLLMHYVMITANSIQSQIAQILSTYKLKS